MNLSVHFTVSVILSIILYPFYGVSSLFSLVGGFLIDIDHLFLTIYYHGIYHPRKVYLFCSKQPITKFKNQIFLFHTIEFFSFLLLGSLFSKYILMALIGFIVHSLMDWYDEYKAGFGHKEFSIFYTLYKVHKIKITGQSHT